MALSKSEVSAIENVRSMIDELENLRDVENDLREHLDKVREIVDALKMAGQIDWLWLDKMDALLYFRG